MASRGDTKGSGLWGPRGRSAGRPTSTGSSAHNSDGISGALAHARTRVWVHACVGVGVWERGRAHGRMCACVCGRARGLVGAHACALGQAQVLFWKRPLKLQLPICEGPGREWGVVSRCMAP